MVRLRAIGVGLALTAGLGLALVGFLYVLPSICIWNLGLGDDRTRDAALEKYFIGHDLFDEGKYEEAAEHYMAWKDFQDADEDDSSEVTGLIGHAFDLAGRTEEARQLIEESLSGQKQWHVCIHKAHFLARHESTSAAVAWLESVELDDVARWKALASFHRERGNHAAAIPVLLRLLKQVDEGGRLVDSAVSVGGEIDTDTHNAIAGLIEPLRDLAESYLHIRQLDRAHEYATLGIKVGQILNRDATYAGNKYVQAGDFRCRIVRARVLMKRDDLTAAEAEIGFARAIADWWNPPFRKKPLQSVTDELERRRRGR